MLIFRRKIANQISKTIGSGKLVLIFGPRQVGKTTLAKKLLEERGDPEAYFNCETLSVREHLVVGNAKSAGLAARSPRPCGESSAAPDTAAATG